MKNNLIKILLVIEVKEKKQVLILLALMLIMAIVEITGIVSVIPFLAVLGDQTLIENNVYLTQVYKLIGFRNHQSLASCIEK